jgi:hypothetical protein
VAATYPSNVRETPRPLRWKANQQSQCSITQHREVVRHRTATCSAKTRSTAKCRMPTSSTATRSTTSRSTEVLGAATFKAKTCGVRVIAKRPPYRDRFEPDSARTVQRAQNFVAQQRGPNVDMTLEHNDIAARRHGGKAAQLSI